MKLIISISISILIVSCTTDKNIDISKYPIVTTVAELSDYYDLNLDKSGQYEKSVYTKYIDGSKELDYTYELSEIEEFDPLYYTINIIQELNIKDAKQSYSIGKGAVNVVGKFTGLKSIKIDSLDLPGDQSHYALITYDDQPSGMFLIIRKGTRIFSMMITGLYTSDHSLIYDLILPKIENLDTYNIMKSTH